MFNNAYQFNLIAFIEVLTKFIICHILGEKIIKKIVSEIVVLQCKWFLAFLAFSREKWVYFSRISREMKTARNVHLY